MVILGALIVVAYSVEWTGFPGKTLWDWLQLLIVPLVIAAGGLWFNRQQRAREISIENERAQDEALQAYLDQMSTLLLDEARPLRQSGEGTEVRILARARTLTMLRRLAGVRKATVVQFLHEAKLINAADDRPIIDLTGADLSRANIADADLVNVCLQGSNLSYADLSGSLLMGSSLDEARLQGANLTNIQLWGASLRETDLRGADLNNASLNIRTALPSVAFQGLEVTDHDDIPEGELQRRADLLSSVGYEEIVNLELEYQAKCLAGATMPDGQQYDTWIRQRVNPLRS